MANTYAASISKAINHQGGGPNQKELTRDATASNRRAKLIEAAQPVIAGMAKRMTEASGYEANRWFNFYDADGALVAYVDGHTVIESGSDSAVPSWSMAQVTWGEGVVTIPPAAFEEYVRESLRPKVAAKGLVS